MEVLALFLLAAAILFFWLWRVARKQAKASNQEAENSSKVADQAIQDANAAKELAHGVSDMDAVKAEVERLKGEKTKLLGEAKELEKGVTDIKTIQSAIQRLEDEKAQLNKEKKALSLEVLADTVRIDAYENLKSDEVKNKLMILRGRQDASVKSGEALVIVSSAAKRVLDSQKKQILRCFNAETSSLIEDVTVKNVDTVRAKIQRSYDAINKIFEVDGVRISQEYLELKYEELSLVYAYMVKEEEEKEQRKAIREQMVEEEKVRREIEREKQKIEKEQTQFGNEVNKLMAYMQKAKDDVERQIYVDKINDLQEKLKALEADKENVLQREQNTRAGFVYIISNIGSLGENVYKIGMTRRLEPMDRIAELSSASVPFPFDVHAMIFSDDAPGLETVLHQYFDAKRVNKVNAKKEFFRVNLEEIKAVVLKNHNATVKFVDVPDATEYRETLRLEREEAAV